MVRYLVGYIKNRIYCPKGTRRIFIKTEIQRFIKMNPGKRPIIIFDFIACISMLIDNEFEIFCGGRHSKGIRRAEFIFTELKKAGADLVFFLDGPLKDEKFRIWVERSNAKYEYMQSVFEDVREGRRINMKFYGKILTTYLDSFRMIACYFGKMFISFVNECDIDLAEYAKRVNALAIFSLDTDFLIMPGQWSVWSPFKIDLEKFSTLSWNKYLLRNSLDLQQNQMPLFATLCGNDFIPLECVQHIHSMLRGSCLQQRLAEYIRRHFPKGEPHSREDIEKLSELIYNNGNCMFSLRKINHLVNYSLNFYNYKFRKDSTIEPQWLKDHIEDTHTTFVYIIWKNIPYTINQSFIDMSKEDVRPYSDLVMPLVQRQMGVVLFVKRKDENLERIIYYKPNHEEQVQSKVFSPTFPNMEIPPIWDILNNNKELSNVNDEEKLKILCWIVSPKQKLKPSHLTNVCKTVYFIPTLILYYLVKELQITVDEADIIILSIHSSCQQIDSTNDNIQPPENFKERPFWLSFVYTYLIYQFNNCAVVSGLFNFTTNSYYDGFIFHQMYSKYLNLDYEEKQKILLPVISYRIYAI